MGELTNAVRLELLAIGMTPTVLIAVLAWWFRVRLKQSLAKALNAHTEEVKLAAQRQIEAYKVSLIASVERQKAQSELKKAIAIKHATQEYEALVELHVKLGAVPGSVLSSASFFPTSGLDQAKRLEAYNILDAELNLLASAADSVHLFISPEQSIELLNLRKILQETAFQCVFLGSSAAPTDEHRQAVTGAAAFFRNVIRDKVSELVRLAESEQTI